MNPLVRYPKATITLPLQYFGSVDYYARLCTCGRVVIDDTARHDKRFKSAHRCIIADTHGRLQLTVPVAKPCIDCQEGEYRPLTWRNIRISDHGQWWQDLDVSIASAYGRTPFYEFYIDRLRPFFSKTTVSTFDSVAALDVALNRVICDILGLESEIVLTSSLKEGLEGVKKRPEDIPVKSVEYYQVRADKFGFLPGLSILDLIFNLGPEVPLVLHAMTGDQPLR